MDELPIFSIPSDERNSDSEQEKLLVIAMVEEVGLLDEIVLRRAEQRTERTWISSLEPCASIDCR